MSDSLPTYLHPPVTETVVGVQFERLSKMKNAHLGAFWNTLDTAEWPTVSDAVALPSQFESFTKAAKWEFGFEVSADQSTRLQIRNTANDRMIQLQNSRFHFNWMCNGCAEYPRYKLLREEFSSYFHRFLKFVHTLQLGDVKPNQWEVTYVNRIPKDTVWESPEDWDFFKPMGSMRSSPGLFDAETFGGEWHFQLPQKQGRLHIQWLHVKDETPEEIRLTFTTRGPMASIGSDSIINGIDFGREALVKSFKELMSDRANTYWGVQL